jgi:hypothetical protein
MTSPYEYVPSTQRNRVKVLGFGNVGAKNTLATVLDAKTDSPESTGFHPSVKGTVENSTVNYYGSPIFVGKTETINNKANLTIQTTANMSQPEVHTSKYGRANGVTGINILTGAVTYFALEGSGYGMDFPFTGVVTDKEVDAIADPYRVPARLTVLNPIAPVSYNHKKAH